MKKVKVSSRRVKTITLVSTWMGVYPLITLLTLIFEPLLSSKPVPVQTLIMSLVMVPLMVLVIMPTMNLLITRFDR